MNTSLNIVELIESNPITKLSNTYQSNLINKIKTKFTENDQQMFVATLFHQDWSNQQVDLFHFLLC